MVKETPRETQIAYSRPPDPGDSNWKAHFEERLRRVVRSQQMHVCSWATCKRYDSHGHPVCKCRAPWELSEDTKVFANGEYIIRHRIPFMNNFNPPLSVTLNCNNDIKLLTNGSDTKHIMWYSTLYQSKKQGKSHNLSTLLAEAYMYHDSKSDTDCVSGVVDWNRLLVFQCENTINCQTELSAQQVIAYLMNWGDTFRSHRYVPFHWSVVQRHLLAVYPGLANGSDA